MERLKDKVALVTGAAGGIGGAIAARFALEGAAVVIADLNIEGAEATAEAIRGDGGRAIAQATDVTDPGAAEAAVGRAVAEYGALHILVNDAAYFTTPATIEDIPIDEWRRSIDVNLTGPFLMSRVAVPAIRNAGGGSIIHIASQLGSVGKPLRSDYCSAKGALIQLARSMAIDYAADNIRVNTLSPGPIGTPRIFERFGSEEAAQRTRGP